MTELFAFGSNGSGQLGVGHIDDVSIPTQCLGLPNNDAIIKVVGGGNHSACLTQSGRVYLAGKSQGGNVDIYSSSTWMQFKEPDILKDNSWKDLACGWEFTLVVNMTGNVYAFGKGGFGEVGPGIMEAKTLVKMEGLQDIVAVACGWRHAVALDNRGCVFGWGWNRYGQLGEGDKVTTIHRLTTPHPVVQIACGHLHTLLLDNCGRVLCLGSDKHGQRLIPDIRFASISSGWNHCGGIDEHGVLTMWGRGDHNQALSDNGVTQFVCGSEHTLALYKKDNTVLAWGWNEHGNCGQSIDKSRSSIPLPKGSVTLLGAGCATSWAGLSMS